MSLVVGIPLFLGHKGNQANTCGNMISFGPNSGDFLALGLKPDLLLASLYNSQVC